MKLHASHWCELREFTSYIYHKKVISHHPTTEELFPTNTVEPISQRAGDENLATRWVGRGGSFL